MDTIQTIGLEEEYFLVDLETLDCVDRVPRGFRGALEHRLGERVGPEIMESMIEVATGIHTSVPSAVAELKELRAALIETAERFGVGVVAAGTHPFADWRVQRRLRKPRYDTVAAELGQVSARIHVCGLHIHVGVGCPEARVDLMNRVQHLVPLILGLSASSPFWRGQETGLASYRSAAQDESPRSGLPGHFANARELDTLMDKLTDGGLIVDPTYVWWVVRPSARYPTLEMRAADSCPILEDVGAVAAFYATALSYLARHPLEFLAWRSHYLHVLEENRWQATRHGLDGRLVDAPSGVSLGMAEALSQWLDRLAPEAERLGCSAELAHGRLIQRRGTASAMLVEERAQALAAGASDEAAMAHVMDCLIAWTRGGPTPRFTPRLVAPIALAVDPPAILVN